jgi:MFS family permease
MTDSQPTASTIASPPAGAAGSTAAAVHRGSGWAPLRAPGFRRLWTAQFVSNIGSWMQTVAAQWVMTSLTSSAVLVTAISAAGSLPVLLLAIPAGALGDLVDRRWLILVTQVVMLAAAAGLAVLAALSALTPTLILVLLFVLGCGSAASAPTWQTLQPELVPPEQRQDAIALGSVNQNLARAVGPALGGLLLAATSAALVFGVNAASFVAVLLGVGLTVLPKRSSTLPREHIVDAVRAGGRYVAFSPTLLALIVRSAAFIFPAGAIWALLPLVARGRLHLGSTGYGLLLGCVGVGAIASATFGPAVRRRFGPRSLYAAAALTIAGATALIAVSHSVYLDAVLLVGAGYAWISGLGLLGAAYQSEMPSWVKARGMSYYLIAFQGSNAIGGLAFGAVAQATSVATSLIVIAITLVLAAIVTWRLALPGTPAADVQPGEPWPVPLLAGDEAADPGPVLVAVRWQVRAQAANEFTALTRRLRAIRRRTGATSWRLYRESDDAAAFVETFIVGSWAEHERQHARIAPRDVEIFNQLDRALESGVAREVHHYLAVSARR